ncbi:MAG: hypothetical protein ACRDL1_04560 [Solirubrobacterales bacterium]
MNKVAQYIPITLYLVTASIVVNVIDNEWGLSSWTLLAATFAIIAIAGFLMPSRPYSRSR